MSKELLFKLRENFRIVYFVQEEEKRGQPNYEHLEEDLHVLIAVEDSEDRATMRLDRAVNEIKMLMKPVV